MKMFIDESGSINNKSHYVGNNHFVIAIVCVKDEKSLHKSFRRFISSNYDALLKLDAEKQTMFSDSRFVELKGNELDFPMKNLFLDYFSQKDNFKVFYIHLINEKLSNTFVKNKARVFNYVLKMCLEYNLFGNRIPSEHHDLLIDERNVSPKSKDKLERYLNKHISIPGADFSVSYHDSKNKEFIQIADVFANILYSNLITSNYQDKLLMLQKKGIIKHIFVFPKETY